MSVAETNGEDLNPPFNRFYQSDPYGLKIEFGVCRDVSEMPAELQDKFKAIKNCVDEINAITEEEEDAYRVLEHKYELLYQESYRKRTELIRHKGMPAQSDLDKFEEKKQALMDDDFASLEVTDVSVKNFQNSLKGIPCFWLNSMVNHNEINMAISEKDRAIL